MIYAVIQIVFRDNRVCDTFFIQNIIDEIYKTLFSRIIKESLSLLILDGI